MFDKISYKLRIMFGACRKFSPVLKDFLFKRRAMEGFANKSCQKFEPRIGQNNVVAGTIFDALR